MCYDSEVRVSNFRHEAARKFEILTKDLNSSRYQEHVFLLLLANFWIETSYIGLTCLLIMSTNMHVCHFVAEVVCLNPGWLVLIIMWLFPSFSLAYASQATFMHNSLKWGSSMALSFWGCLELKNCSFLFVFNIVSVYLYSIIDWTSEFVTIKIRLL